MIYNATTGHREFVNAYIGIGSNLHDPLFQVTEALKDLGKISASVCIAHSSFYRSPPMGLQSQPDYINAVARLHTRLEPLELLDELQYIEYARGRVRTNQRWEPRILDLDILLYGDHQLSEARLTIPHPGIQQRAFVLYPLEEINPDLDIPGHGPIANLIENCSRSELERLRT